MSHLTACGLVCVPGCVPSSDSGCLKHVKTGITKGHVAACGAACLGVQAGAGIGFAAGVCSLAQGAIAMGVTAPAFGAAVCTVQRQCRNSCQHGNVGHEAGTVGTLASAPAQQTIEANTSGTPDQDCPAGTAKPRI